jgi:hypothetical protein
MKMRDLMPFTRTRNGERQDDIFGLIYREMNRAMDDTYHGSAGGYEYAGGGEADEKASGNKQTVEVFRERAAYSVEAKNRLRSRKSSREFGEKTHLRRNKIATH